MQTSNQLVRIIAFGVSEFVNVGMRDLFTIEQVEFFELRLDARVLALQHEHRESDQHDNQANQANRQLARERL